jgi:hypothetical protein
MKFRLTIVALCAASFAWGFSTLVHQTDTTMRSETTRLACQDWAGNGCARTFER